MVSGPSGINTPTGVAPSDQATMDDVTSVGGPDAPGHAGSRAAGGADDDFGWLVPVLDTLLPANGELPAAGAMGLVGEVLLDAQWAPEFAESLDWLSERLPATFAASGLDERVEVLSALETAEPRIFANIVNLAYNAYYTNPQVLALIERESGFTATPPQPGGYELEPFDPAILATISQREPFWRK